MFGVREPVPLRNFLRIMQKAIFSDSELQLMIYLYLGRHLIEKRYVCAVLCCVAVSFMLLS